MQDQSSLATIQKYEENYSPDTFWKKIRKTGAKAGKQLVEKALSLYYSAKDDDTPRWARGVIYGALGYFITPIDLLPDIAPVMGFTDDLGVIISAFAIVAIYIKDRHKKLAGEKVEKWFGQS